MAKRFRGGKKKQPSLKMLKLREIGKKKKYSSKYSLNAFEPRKLLIEMRKLSKDKVG